MLVRTTMTEYLRDVYGPAHCYDPLPEGTTVGTDEQFVGFSIGFSKEHLLLPDEADRLAALLQEAAKKCRQRHAEIP
jgi:hypothetical protein